MSAGSKNTHFCDSLLTLEERESLLGNSECVSCAEHRCAPFILPRTRISRTPSRNKAGLIECVSCAVIVTAVIYSVVMNSLPALMFAIILTGLYIVLSHFYQETVEARNEIEEKNLMNLISPAIGRN